jgi:hypothetical protein
MNHHKLFDPLGSAFVPTGRGGRDLREHPPGYTRWKPARSAAVAVSVALLVAAFATVAGQHEAKTARSVAVAELRP